jgi:transcription factor IIIB subunit 2
MHRYQTLQDEVAKWTEEVEWLDSYQKFGKRAKVSKRLLCARGLKDALSWKSGLWNRRVETEGKLNLEPHLHNFDNDLDLESNSSRDDPSRIAKREDLRPSRKKRKVGRSTTTTDAAHFLLDPAASTASLGTTFSAKALPSAFTMSCYILSVPSFISSSHVIPSRLQRLSVARGGSDVILDDELFADGEWETIQRSPEEMQKLEQQWRDEGMLDVLERAGSAALKKFQSRKQVSDCAIENLRRPGSKRIDLEALSRFMRGGNKSDQIYDLDMSEMLGLEILEDGKEDKDSDEYREGNMCYGPSAVYGDEEEITVDDWRPCSPKSFVDYYLGNWGTEGSSIA